MEEASRATDSSGKKKRVVDDKEGRGEDKENDMKKERETDWRF
jgi:hypothetical protein